jgi:hypothetical protein
MSNRLQQLLTEVASPLPPVGLFEAVMARIAWELKALNLKRRVTFYGVATVTLAALLAVTFADVRTAMTGSGNLEFLSLAFTDTRMVLANWGSFIASVLESLPVGRLAAFLTVGLLFILTLRALIRDTRLAHHRQAPHGLTI